MIKVTFISKVADGKVVVELNSNKRQYSESSKVYVKAKDFLKEIAKKPARLAVQMEDKMVF